MIKISLLPGVDHYMFSIYRFLSSQHLFANLTVLSCGRPHCDIGQRPIALHHFRSVLNCFPGRISAHHVLRPSHHSIKVDWFQPPVLNYRHKIKKIEKSVCSYLVTTLTQLDTKSGEVIDFTVHKHHQLDR